MQTCIADPSSNFDGENSGDFASQASLRCDTDTHMLSLLPSQLGLVLPGGAPRASVLPTAATSLCMPRFSSVVSMEESATTAAAPAEELCGVLPDDVCEQIYEDADAVFTVIDEDGNGSITVTELTNHLSKAGYNDQAIQTVFAKLDADSDGELTKEELRAGFLNFAPLREAPGLGSYNAKFVDEIHQDADALFNAIDTNGDGSISKDELREHLKTFSNYSFKAISKLFKMLDVNKDGGIEKEEMRAAFVKYSALRQAIGQGPSFK